MIVSIGAWSVERTRPALSRERERERAALEGRAPGEAGCSHPLLSLRVASSRVVPGRVGSGVFALRSAGLAWRYVLWGVRPEVALSLTGPPQLSWGPGVAGRGMPENTLSGEPRVLSTVSQSRRSAPCSVAARIFRVPAVPRFRHAFWVFPPYLRGQSGCSLRPPRFCWRGATPASGAGCPRPVSVHGHSELRLTVEICRAGSEVTGVTRGVGRAG